MREIVLVRHGQASFGSEDYDKLSETGHAQMEVLGRYWQVQGLAVDRLITGPLRRHHESTAGLLRGYPGLPAATEHAGFAEFPAFALVDDHVEAVAETDEPVAAYLREREAGAHLTPPLLMRVLSYWARGEIEPKGPRSFSAFHERVQGALVDVMASVGPGERAVVVTSGGPVSMAVMRALALDAERAIGLCFSVVNASFSVMRWFDEGEMLRLFRFNAHPHLEPAGDITFV